MPHPFTFINEFDHLEQAMARFADKPVIAMDLEGEFNLHRYGMHICLIQVSDGNEIYLIDPIAIKNLDPFLDLYENPAIRKITHGPESDFLLLNRFYGRSPRNVFDTQKAAIFLNYEGTSLSALLVEHFEVEKNVKIRENDWTQRPIPENMLAYAAKDVAFLIPLSTALTEKLIKIDRLSWLEEECELLEELRYTHNPDPHLKIKGAKSLSAREINILRHIFFVREEIAMKLDKPAAYILPNKMMLEFAQNPPANEEDWKIIRGVHPKLKNFAKNFSQSVATGLSEKLIPKKSGSDFNFRWEIRNNPEFKTSYYHRKAILDQIKLYLDQHYDISTLILSQKSIHKLSCGQPLAVLKNWQKEVLLKEGKVLNIPLAEFDTELSPEVLNRE